MLVEDEQLLRRSLARHIANLDMGFAVTCEASDGKEALELLGRNDVHLIITDIRMPVMEGLELLDAVNTRYPHIKVVLLTGHAEFSYAQQALRGGALDYLLKPVSVSALEQMLLIVKTRLGADWLLEEDGVSSGVSAEETMNLLRNYIRGHFAEDIDMASLASSFGFSSAYLSKIFNRFEGTSPVKYLTSLRINEARHLLLNTNLTIKEVGERVGYDDQFYFSNVFRKTTGSSSSVFRAENSNKHTY